MLQGKIFRNRPSDASHRRCPAYLIHLTRFPQEREQVVKRVHLEEVGALREKNGFQEHPGDSRAFLVEKKIPQGKDPA